MESATDLQCLKTLTRVISNVCGEDLRQRGRAKRLIGPGGKYQDRTSASDRPADCVSCPMDSVLIEERDLFDGGGVFRWTLWSRHGGELNVERRERGLFARARALNRWVTNVRGLGSWRGDAQRSIVQRRSGGYVVVVAVFGLGRLHSPKFSRIIFVANGLLSASIHAFTRADGLMPVPDGGLPTASPSFPPSLQPTHSRLRSPPPFLGIRSFPPDSYLPVPNDLRPHSPQSQPCSQETGCQPE